MRCLLLLGVVAWCWAAAAQPQAGARTYARTVLDSLCAPALHGRGYVAEGERLAANYLEREFRRLGLQPLRQSFEHSVNTLPGRLECRLGKRRLRPGVDYLVSPDAPATTLRRSEIVPLPNPVPDDLGGWLREQSGRTILVREADFPRTTAQDKERYRNLLLTLKNSETPHAAILLVVTGTPVHDAADHQARRALVLVPQSVVGETPARHLSLRIEARLEGQFRSYNVYTTIPGTRTDSVLMVTAHYDHLGRMGRDTYFAGASDNASGVAMLLALARHYATHTPRFTTVLVAFAAEEIGLVGSQHWVQHPPVPLQRVHFLLNLDLLGTGDDGIMVVNATSHPARYEHLVGLNTSTGLLPAVKQRGPACNSDHCPFHAAGVPCFYVYTLGGSAAYHSVLDTPDRLSLSGFNAAFELLRRFLDSF